MKFLRVAFFVALSLVAGRNLSGQGFINLNFEQSTIVSSSPSGYGFNIGTADVPGWAAYGWEAANYSGGTSLIYNNQPMSDAGVSLLGTDYPVPAIQGQYSILLLGGTPPLFPEYGGSSIEQTGLIPPSAKSISYWEGSYDAGPLHVTFNGQPLSFTAVGGTANYTVWLADISAYAGQTGPLVFTAPWESGGMIDNIQFLSSPAPEPGTLCLICIGLLFLFWRMKPSVTLDSN